MIEILIVAVLVVWSALVVFKRYFRIPHAQSSRSCLMPVQPGLAHAGEMVKTGYGWWLWR